MATEIINIQSAMFRKIVLCGIGLTLSLATCVLAHDSKVLWSRTVLMQPADGRGPGWFLIGVEQQEEHLVGIFGYGKTIEPHKAPEALSVHGTESSDGVFWPRVTLEVKDTVSADWNKIEGYGSPGKSKIITIAPGELKLYLLVNFDLFKTFLDRFKEGQVTFENGEKVSFSFDYLRNDK